MLLSFTVGPTIMFVFWSVCTNERFFTFIFCQVKLYERFHSQSLV